VKYNEQRLQKRLPDRLDAKAHINRLEQSIVEIIPGD
jgi:anti-sigma factor RsiW